MEYRDLKELLNTLDEHELNRPIAFEIVGSLAPPNIYDNKNPIGWVDDVERGSVVGEITLIITVSPFD